MRPFSLLLAIGLGWMPLAAGAQSAAGEAAPAAQAPAMGKIACPGHNPVVIRTKDAQAIAASLSALDAAGVDYQEKSPIDGVVKGRVAWALLSASAADAVLKAGIEAKDATQLVFAGRVLQSLPDGVAKADQWYAKAVRLGAEAQVAQARQAPPLFPPVMAAGPVTEPLSRTNPQAWPEESGGSMRAALEEAVDLTNQALTATKLHMSMNQNPLFVLYSDLSAADTRKWASRFNHIYAGISQAFGCANTNIWHGKAVVLLFKSRQEYLQYTEAAFHAQLAGSAGVCFSRSDGMVSIAMFQDTGNRDLESVIYHEFTHGFIHRYKAKTPIRSWANEGLAEFMANRFTRANHSETWRARSSIEALKKSGSLEDFFTTAHIQGKHYGVAGDITRMMVECSPQRYAAFLGWMKQGATDDVALKNSYGMDVEGLVKAYGRRIGCEGLRSH